MSIDHLFLDYILCDGQLQKFSFDLKAKSAEIELAVRKKLRNKEWKSIIIALFFDGVAEVNIYEDFPTDGGYSDITFCEVENNSIYLSLDPHGNSGKPHVKDNWVVKAKSVSISEIS